MRASHKVTPVFDDPNLIGTAGLIPVLRLGEEAGLHDLLEAHLTVGSPAASIKSVAVIAGMLAGADSIDDLDVLRHGGMARVFTGIRAPSTLGTFLRTFTHGHVQQVDAAAGRVLAGLTARVPALLAGATRPDGIAFLDIDDTIRQVHGYAKQGAAYGYTRVLGLNAQIAVLSTPDTAPLIAAARLRSGNTISGQAGARLVTQAIGTARRAGVAGQVMVRADSGYHRHDLVTAAVRAGAWFSVTVRKNPQVTAAISRIPDHKWTPIKYPHAVWEETSAGEGYWVSDAEVAEIDFTAFTSRRKTQQVNCRLVVRRVKRLNPSDDHTVQDELLPGYRHHGFITNSTLTLLEADQRHRDHAVVEQVIAELKAGPLAHLPSGRYAANAAWLAHAVIAFNLARAAGHLAGTRHARARWATLRTHLINVPARVATSAGRIRLHLPRDWPWAPALQALFDRACAPPATAAP